MGSVPQARLKLEVPMALNSNSLGSFEETQHVYLSESLRKFGIALGDVVETTVEEPGCLRFFMYNYEVSSNSFSETLLPAIRHFLSTVQAIRIPHFLKSTLIIHSTSCFSNRVVSCHRHIPVEALFFGNIQGGVFINHWEVSFRESCEYSDVRSVPILADFLYDQSEVINITFENEEYQYKRNYQSYDIRCKKVKLVQYQVSVRVNFIRRIVVDNAVNDSYGRGRTRFHFELNCPVVIRYGITRNTHGNQIHHPKLCRCTTIGRGRNPNEIPHVLAISDSPVFTIEFDGSLPDLTIYAILSRLRVRSGISIEFASLDIVDRLYSARYCPYACWTHKENEKVNAAMDDKIMTTFIKDTVRSTDVDAKGISITVVRERKFSLRYLLECLISRGAVVKDQLLLDEAIWIGFLKLINFCYRQNREACLCALERVVTMIDERKRIGSIAMAFTYEFETQRKCGTKLSLSLQEIRDGYRRMRKLVITQTRIIYVVPETIMENRVTRMYDTDGTRIIRVAFRDDDNQIMRTNKTSKYLIENTLKKYLTEGVVVADRHFGYLGNSNSQMRDSGAYFLEKYSTRQLTEYKEKFGLIPPITWQPKIDEARRKLGRFNEIENIPKLMARLGQCFTQSKKTSYYLLRHEYYTSFDYVGGCDKKGKEYTFSDGVGMISKSLATEIAKEMMLGSCVPSCYQFRFRGVKGVVCTNPLLDEIAEWAKKHRIEPPRKDFGSWDLKLIFRPSQVKFQAMRTATESLEIVKYSAPVPVSLNKPFICILDQVSEMQSHSSHLRMTNRIEELVDIQLQGLARTMLHEHDCRNKLKELPRRINIDVLSELAGFQLSTEPFFRSIIKATIKFTINKQMHKQQIQIPYDKGRTMFGVVDETGQLQRGQIFVQYTENISLKNPPHNASKKILTGKVLLTKNPCIVAGDVRMFTAVNIFDLHHLCDVVVFPIHGPRPHTDEMAGSDLDGDEYVVIWDEELLLDRNEEPFDYTADKPEAKPINEETLTDDMADFYVKYITQDSVGAISNSFLFQADLYGIKSEVCHRLAKKISQAVDFTKTGLPPEPLVRGWTIEERTGKEIPPERSERNPDFHIGSGRLPVYRSSHLLGGIYRQLQGIEDVLKVSENIGEQQVVECDKFLIVDGWYQYKEVAEEQISKYNGRLRALMENYGIKMEGEIFSGCISEMRNRISDRDQDDMSFYNTAEVIEKKVTSIFREYREEFFEEFGGWQSCTIRVDKKFAVEENVFHRIAKRPTIEMQQKAVAYYRICYEMARQTGERMLSFAWLAYDVLAVIRQENLLKETDITFFATPLCKMLKVRISDYCEKNKEEFQSFLQFPNEEAYYQLQLYISCYPGLERVMFIIIQWAKSNKILDIQLQCHHVCLILILYAIGQITGSFNRSKPFLEKLKVLQSSEFEPERIDEECQIEMVLAFFEYLASRAFRKLPFISFSDLEYSSVLLRGEWLPMHEAAVRTYYNMVFNLQFEELSESRLDDSLSKVIVRECEPFVIELPEKINEDAVKSRILQKTGVDEVSLRRIGNGSVGRVVVLARGTPESLQKLRNLVTVRPLINMISYGMDISAQLSRLVYENIMS